MSTTCDAFLHHVTRMWWSWWWGVNVPSFFISAFRFLNAGLYGSACVPAERVMWGEGEGQSNLFLVISRNRRGMHMCTLRDGAPSSSVCTQSSDGTWIVLLFEHYYSEMKVWIIKKRYSSVQYLAIQKSGSILYDGTWTVLLFECSEMKVWMNSQKTLFKYIQYSAIQNSGSITSSMHWLQHRSRQPNDAFVLSLVWGFQDTAMQLHTWRIGAHCVSLAVFGDFRHLA